MNILFFSYLSRDKGIFVAVKAMQIILEKTNCTVTFAGPVEDEEIESILKGLELYYPRRVEILGYIESPVEKAKIFKRADIFIFPTLRESFGLVLLEAMSFGLPIVASREGSIPEILPNGLLFTKGNVEEMASQVMALIGNKELRMVLGKLNKQRYEECYTIEKYGARMVELFNYLECDFDNPNADCDTYGY